MHQVLRQSRNTTAITSALNIIAGLQIYWRGLGGLMILEVYAQSTQHPTRLGDEILSPSLVVPVAAVANRA
jgi:hypothetical protein